MPSGNGNNNSLAEDLAHERALRLQAEEANRIKDEFLGTLSHELRTPLNAITGWAHILQSGALGPADQARALETILRNAKLQARLIENLLDVSRIISGKLRLDLSPLDFTKSVQVALEAATPAARDKNVHVTVELAQNAAEVSGDAVRLQQVIGNLLNNAIKFCEPGGHISVRTSLGAKRVLLAVEDDGRGIEPSFLPLLFERFRQAGHPLTRARGGGLGLGLAIARYLVEAHQGSIKAESAGIGQGTRLSVSLPLVQQSASAIRPEEAPVTVPPPLLGAYILVIDDDDDTRELLELLLVREGAEVALAASGIEARALISARHPDLIVCDVGMPEEDGHAFIRALRASGERSGAFIPALALTGHAGAADTRATLLAGFEMHVSKPLDPPRLLDSLAKLWRRGIARNS